MSNYTYNTREDRMEGASFGATFFSASKDGTISCSYESTPTYNYVGKPIFSAEQNQKSVAIFESRPIVMSSSVVSWKNLIWNGYTPEGSQIYVYLRSASSKESLKTEKWNGPFLNEAGEDISSQTGRILQFKIALYSTYNEEFSFGISPVINSVLISCYVQGLSQTFYTSALSLGFIPKQVVVTYNGSIPEGTIINFAVSTTDSIDTNDYKVIDLNTVEELEEIAKNKFLKMSISALGNTEIPFIVDEFAIAIGGEGFSLIK